MLKVDNSCKCTLSFRSWLITWDFTMRPPYTRLSPGSAMLHDSSETLHHSCLATDLGEHKRARQMRQ